MLLECLKELPDHRRGQARQYKLDEILFVSVLAILSGADSYRDITRFAQERLKQLKKWFSIKWKKAPGKSNLGKIFCKIDREAMEKVFREYSNKLLNETEEKEGKVRIAIDGKILKRSFDHGKGNEKINLLNAFCVTNKLIIGHIEIPKETNEIPIAQALIEELKLPKGSVYTLDAMHCQKNV